MSNAVTEPIDDLQSLTSLTVLNATAALERGYAALKAGQTVFDLRHVLTVDSVAVSVMLSWQRAALDAGVQLRLQNLPPALQSLTKLYGVCSLLFPDPAVADKAALTGAGDTAVHHPH
ncbi:STAS domain-containing protein [Duganella sp. FT94W]|uniref:STAS domain-containing protein n=1 Tax=Duganella lactea TaxID=2692173 RepID=A0ABW9V126_9BURK|nr:STAS domain-containing protein [Duganella lactea]MYM32898.1 STAS domain-containing protein [Duganella lactea]